MHNDDSSSSNPFLSLEQSRNEVALRTGHFRVDDTVPGPTEIIPIQAIEEADCRARLRSPTPGSCNTGVKIEDQGALQHAGTPERTHAPGSPTPEAYFDSLRVDTLKLSAEVDRETAVPVGEHWIDKKREAAGSDELPIVTAHDGTELKVHPHDPNDNRTVLLKGSGVVVTAVPRGNTPVPFLSVEFGATWCWNHSLDELAEWARDFAVLWGLELGDTLVSRMDVCTDVDERFYRSDVDRFEGRHRGNLTGTVAFSDGRNGFTGLRYSRTADRNLTFRIYDKRAEVDSRDGRSFWPEVWDAHNVPEESPVWRVEFEAQRSKLRERGIDSWEDLTRGKIESFWSYCTEEFARMDRQAWDRTQDASTQDPAERVETDPVHDPERKELQIMGLAKSIADRDENRTVEDVLKDLPDKYL